MRVMRMCSGLGNTMFQYAVYIQLKKMYPEENIFIDTLWYRYTEELDKFELPSVFNLQLPDFFELLSMEEKIQIEKELEAFRYWKLNGYKTRDEMLKKNKNLEIVSRTLTHEELPELYNQISKNNFRIISDEKMNHISLKKILISQDSPEYVLNKRSGISNYLRKYFPMLFYVLRFILNREVQTKFIRDVKCKRKPDFTGCDGIGRLYGTGDIYYNIYGNFNDCEEIRDRLLSDFRFAVFDSADVMNIEMEQQIKSCNSVSIHARVNDFDYGVGAEVKRGYFKKAVNYIKRNVMSPVFYVFSDNIEWCKRNLNILGLQSNDSIFFVSHNFGKNSYKDMQLMSMCQHNIVPQSTFSWWGAYLNQNPNKIVVTPYATFPGTVSF